jgi:threonine dehydrogenase-like Zn-dependent dehydrogenase
MGANVIAIDIMPERLALARELGADHVINSREGDAVAAIRDMTGGAGASAVLETSGNPQARAQAVQCLRPFGRCCYVGVGGPAVIDFNRDVIFKVATIYGSWTFSKSELLEIARFMVDARVPVDKLITHRYRLDQAVEAFRTFDSATTGKCVFVMD